AGRGQTAGRRYRSGADTAASDQRIPGCSYRRSAHTSPRKALLLNTTKKARHILQRAGNFFALFWRRRPLPRRALQVDLQRDRAVVAALDVHKDVGGLDPVLD